MRNIYKSIFFALCIVALGSCEDDKDPVVSANGFELRSVDSASPLVLTPQNDANSVVTLQWDKSDNVGAASVSSYTVEIAQSGNNFANPLALNAGNPVTTDRSYVLKVAELNKLVNQFPDYVCGQQIAVDIRVKSVLGSGFYNSFTQYSSNTVTLNVTPYSVKLPTLIFASSAPNATSAGNLAASSVINTDYEGYIYLQPGTYKFYKPNSCGDYGSPEVYGTNGTALALNGSDIQITTAGHYLVKADTQALSFSVRATTWNIYGTAKSSFPGANTVMEYEQSTGLWKVTANLGEGYGFKFRSNGTSPNILVLGAFNNTVAGSLFAGSSLTYVPVPVVETAPNFVQEVKTSENRPAPRVNRSFTITLDLNSPRDYKYTVTAN